MLWIILSLLVTAGASPVRICVPETLSESCAQMSQDLPDIFQCVVAVDTFECIKNVHQGEADVTNVDPSGLYLAGQFYQLRPVATELVNGDAYRYQGIAVVRKESDIQSAGDLKGRRSCHTGMGRTVGWQIPVSRMLSQDILPSNCTHGELGAVERFFDGSCVPGAWSSDPVVDRSLKTEFSKLCSRCKNPSECAADDPYAGYEGVLNCLSEGAADVAFTKIDALRDYLAKHPDFAENAEILCFEGGRVSVQENKPCIWGYRPTNAFVARYDDTEDSRVLRALLETQIRYSVPQVRVPEWYHKSFLSDSKVSGLMRTEDQRNSHVSYLGDFIHAIRKPRHGCEGFKDNEAAICVTSDIEKLKCEHLSQASEAKGLWPDVRCVEASSKAACMQVVKEDNAQLLVLDGGDVYKAGRYFGLQPIASELYNGSDATYYAVAVLRSASDVTKLADLFGLRSCHTGMGRTAGWVMPVGLMVSQGIIGSGQSCNNHANEIADFFSGGSCVPGANDTKLNPGRERSEDLCKRCVGDDQGLHKCSRDSKERFSGYAGALRCLAEGHGDVAFVKHTTVHDYTDGHSKLPWTRDLLSTDFKLLCERGGTTLATKYEECHLGKVPSHQVVTGGNLPQIRRLLLSRLLADSSKNFGPNSVFFRLFGPGKEADLLFKDSATGLKMTPLDATYEQVLGSRFLEASRAADPKNCQTK